MSDGAPRGAGPRSRSAPTHRRKAPDGADARRVVVVSGDADLMRSLQILLEDEAGVGVIPAGSGEAVIEAIGNDLTVALALVDLDEAPAPAFLDAMRVSHAALPVVVMTAYPPPDRPQRARELGALACLAKPIDPEELLAQVRRALAAPGPHVGPPSGRSGYAAGR